MKQKIINAMPSVMIVAVLIIIMCGESIVEWLI